jgi:hypothetical protein
LLLEEVQNWPDEADSSPAAAKGKRYQPPPHYGDAAFMEEQKRLIDLIPRRLPGVGAVLLAGLGIIAAIVGLHYWAGSAAERFPDVTLTALNLSAAGSLAQWFSSLLLLAATGASLLVYFIRRQRNDDYQGRYRVWLWAALTWFLFATDVSVGLNRTLQQSLVHLTGTPLWKEGVLWWIIPYTVAFAAIGSRLVVDMWPSRLAISAFALAVTGYVVALLASLKLLPENLAADMVMVHGGAVMFGHLLLLLTMILQARYVLMDYEGLIPPRVVKAPKPKKIVKKKAVVEVTEKEEEDAASDDEQWHRVDSSQGTPQPVLRRAAPTPTTVTTLDADNDSDDDDPPNPTGRKLTKQEKKALKERLLRERASREKKMSKW